jgi:hypothetical protein
MTFISFTLYFLVLSVILTPVFTFIHTGFTNPFKYKKLKEDILSEVNENLNYGWQFEKIGTISHTNKTDGVKTRAVYIEIKANHGNGGQLFWINDFVYFQFKDGKWRGNFDRLKLQQNLYDRLYEESTGISLKGMQLTEEREKKLNELLS